MDKTKKIAGFIIKGTIILAAAGLILWFAVPAIKKMYTGSENGQGQNAAEQEGEYLELFNPIDMSKKEAEMASEQSDIKGWTKLDKHKVGLQIQDGSDTDGDGLTDKEEIEEYGSDPTKKSTAGDLYTDGYKASHGMDINKAYEMTEDPEFPNNECPEISLTPVTAEDLDAYVSKDASSSYAVDGHTIRAAYYIYGFRGEVKADLSQLLTDSSLDIRDIEIFGCGIAGEELNPIDAKKEGSSVTFTSPRESLVVLITTKDKHGLFDGLKKNAGSASVIEPEQEQGDAIVWATLISPVLGRKPRMYYVSSGDQSKDKAMMDDMIAIAEKMTDAEMFRYNGTISLFYHPNYYFTHEDFKEVSQTKLNSIRSMLEGLPDGSHYTKNSGGESFVNYFAYSDVAHSGNGSGSGGYNYQKDELPFQNFGTEYSPEGMCAGISHLTAAVHNSGGIDPQGSYEIDGYGTVSWDLGEDSENSTFMDPYLYDYKDKGFVDSHNGMLTKGSISEAEEQFVNMIGCYWAMSNDKCPITDYVKYNSENETYSYDLIEKMKKYLDSGKILDAGFVVVSKNDKTQVSAHAINIVRYEEADDSDRTVFYVYDSNYPDINEFMNGLPMVVQRKGDSFIYTYEPRWSSSIITNDPEYADMYGMVVADENFEILN